MTGGQHASYEGVAMMMTGYSWHKGELSDHALLPSEEHRAGPALHFQGFFGAICQGSEGTK